MSLSASPGPQKPSDKKGSLDPKRMLSGNFSKDDLMSFIIENKWDTIAYLILFCGLLFSIFERFSGGIIVGTILGIYFSKTLKKRIETLKEVIDREGIFRSFVVVAAFLALFIASSGLFIGTVIGVFLRPAFGDAISESEWQDDEHEEDIDHDDPGRP